MGAVSIKRFIGEESMAFGMVRCNQDGREFLVRVHDGEVTSNEDKKAISAQR